MEMEVGEREIEGKEVIGKRGLEHTWVASKALVGLVSHYDRSDH